MSRNRAWVVSAVLAFAGLTRPVCAQRILVGKDSPGTPQVTYFQGSTLATLQDFPAYDVAFTGGVRVALGDVDGDGILEIITGAGPGAGPHVKVFRGSDLAPVHSFFAFSPSFTGGVFVAAGDVNGDGKADLVAGSGSGAGTVTVFHGVTLAVLTSFFPFGAPFTGGVTVAAGDVNGDGLADIITGAGPGGGPNVKVFKGSDLTVLHDFFAFSPSFTGGVFVAAGDFNGDGKADMVVGAGATGGPAISVFDGVTHDSLASFFAYAPGFTGGVRVAAGDVNGDATTDIVAGPGTGLSNVKAFSGLGESVLQDFSPFGTSFTSGLFVAAPPMSGPAPAGLLSFAAD